MPDPIRRRRGDVADLLAPDEDSEGRVLDVDLGFTDEPMPTVGVPPMLARPDEPAVEYTPGMSARDLSSQALIQTGREREGVQPIGSGEGPLRPEYEESLQRGSRVDRERRELIRERIERRRAREEAQSQLQADVARERGSTARGQQYLLNQPSLLARELGATDLADVLEFEHGPQYDPEGFALGMANVIPSFGDEAIGRLRSAAHGTEYEDELARARREYAAARERAPGSVLTGEVVSGIPLGVGVGRAVGAGATALRPMAGARGLMGTQRALNAIATGAAPTAGLGARMARMGAEGAVMGGIAGAGAAEGDAGDRLAGAGMGVVGGGALGAALPALGAGVRAATAPLREGAENIAGHMRQAGMLLGDDMDTAEAALRRQYLGRDAFSDMLDPAEDAVAEMWEASREAAGAMTSQRANAYRRAMIDGGMTVQTQGRAYRQALESIDEILEEVAEQRRRFGGPEGNRLQRVLNRIEEARARGTSRGDLASLMSEMNNVKAYLGSLVRGQRGGRFVRPSPATTERMSSLYGNLRTMLEDESLWGGAAGIHRRLNPAWSEYIGRSGALDDLVERDPGSRFSLTEGGELFNEGSRPSRGAIEDLVRGASEWRNRPRIGDVQQAGESFAGFLDAATPEYQISPSVAARATRGVSQLSNILDDANRAGLVTEAETAIRGAAPGEWAGMVPALRGMGARAAGAVQRGGRAIPDLPEFVTGGPSVAPTVPGLSRRELSARLGRYLGDTPAPPIPAMPSEDLGEPTEFDDELMGMTDEELEALAAEAEPTEDLTDLEGMTDEELQAIIDAAGEQ
jgi:hypothetical protein